MTYVSIVKCSSYNKSEVYSAVKKSVSLIGGLNIKNGSKVLIKPNLLSPKHPKLCVTTHPEVVRAIIKLLKLKKCRISVGDSPGINDPVTTAKVAGILQVCEEEKVNFVPFKKSKSYFYKDALYMHRFDLCDIISDMDYIINVPKLKTHVLMNVTLAIKNSFGFMVGTSKGQMHLKMGEKDKFASMLVDLSNFVKPHINIIDGIMGMEGEGPGSGTPKKVGIISASYDSLALDIVMSRMMGFDPMSILTNKIALSNKNEDYLKSIKVVGERLKILKFKPATPQALTFIFSKNVAQFVNRVFSAKPFINYNKCKACKECIKICPAKTIIMKNGKAFIKKKKCIRCFCCHEICPFHAIDLKKWRL
ncbi:MAG: DUF362 domain-containing protein [Nanoarchaeota archaeon]